MNTTQPTNNKAAIVILNWNGSKMMQQYLPNVIECSKDEAQVIIADNASTDDSLQMLSRDFPQLRTIVLDDNYGFAEGYNRALKQVDAEYYVLLNSDVEVTPHWLKPLLKYMDTHPECAVCQPKLRSIFHREEFEYAGASGGKLDILGYPFCRGRIFDIVEKDHGQYDTPDLLAWATGACMVIRKKDYWEAGALDKRFFAHNEEIDLCWRLRIMGRDIMLVPQSVVYHVGGGTLPKSNPMKTFLNFRNNLTMIYKNVESERLRAVMRCRWFLDYLAAFEMLILKRNFGDFKAVIKGRKAFAAWRKDFTADRNRIQSMRKKSDSEILYRHSILWQYYAKGHKTYTQLDS